MNYALVDLGTRAEIIPLFDAVSELRHFVAALRSVVELAFSVEQRSTTGVAKKVSPCQSITNHSKSW